MKRTTLIAGAALIAVASTAVIATAHDRGNGERAGRGGPEMLFERLDTDGDGSITREEIEAAGVARFTEADTNGDGQLSAEEMAAAAEARRATRNAERQADRIARQIERVDTNEDGMISLEEATAAASEGRIDKMFERVDADGDGVITKAEAEEMRGKWRRGGRGHGHGNK